MAGTPRGEWISPVFPDGEPINGIRLSRCLQFDPTGRWAAGTRHTFVRLARMKRAGQNVSFCIATAVGRNATAVWVFHVCPDRMVLRAPVMVPSA